LLGYKKKPQNGFKMLKPLSKFRAAAYAVIFPLLLLGSSIERKGRNKYSDA